MKYQAIDKVYRDYLKEKEQDKKLFNCMINGMRYGFVVFFIIILTSLILSGNLVFAQTSDIDYTWNEVNLIDNAIYGEKSLLNREYPKSFTGNYNGSYSFTEEINLINTEISFISSITENIAIIESEKNGHNAVLNFTDESASVNILTNSFLDQTTGVLEFWFLSMDVTKRTNIICDDDGHNILYLRMINSDLKYYDGAVVTSTGLTMVNDCWYYIKLQFYNDDTWDYWINGVLYADGVDTKDPITDGIDELTFFVYDKNDYYDAIGYSWDSFYNIGDNLFPLKDNLDNNSVAIEYFIASGIEQNDINNTYYLDGNEWIINSQDLGGDTEAVSINFDVFTHSIYNISELTVSYSIRISITTGDDLLFKIEGHGTWNETTGLLLYGINETIGDIQYSVGDSVEIDCIQYSQVNQFVMYVDFLRFDYVPLVDKMEFAFNSTGSLNQIGDDDVNGWIDIENDYYNDDAVNLYYSDDVVDRSIRIFGYADGWCGIERTFSHEFGDINNVSWQFDLNAYGRGGNKKMWIDIEIYSYDQTKIFYLRMEGQSHFGWGGRFDNGQIYWYNGIEFIYLQEQLPADNIDFSISWINGFGSGKLNINDNSYTILNLDNTKTGIGKIRIAGMVDDYIVSGKLDLEIDNVAIYIDALSTSDDGFSTQLFYYLGVDAWSFKSYPFIEIDFDIEFQNNISIVLNGDYDVVDYGETFGLDYWWEHVYNTTNYPYPYFEIFNGTGSDFNIINVKIYGIRLIEGSNEYVPSFTYNSVDIQDSYFYVENNQLQYILETDDIYVEYIQIDVDIGDIYSRNRSFSIEHRKSIPNLFAEVRVIYTDSTFSYFESQTSLLSPNTILPQDKIIDTFQFIITDNDNDYNDVLTGYFSDISLIYYPNVDTLLPIINFIAIIPILVILLVIPLFLYIRFKMKWIFLPCVVIFAIIGTGSGIIPLWLTVVIIFSIVSFYIIQKKSSD